MTSSKTRKAKGEKKIAATIHRGYPSQGPNLVYIVTGCNAKHTSDWRGCFNGCHHAHGLVKESDLD